MTPKQIDIHNFPQKEVTATKKLKQANISERNKKLILEFVNYKSLTVKMGTARRLKIMSALKQVAFLITKDFDKVKTTDLERVVGQIQKEDYSAWTVSDYNKILKQFYKWLIPKAKLNVQVDWINGRIKPKDMPRLKRSEMLTEEEAHKLIETSTRARDKAIFALIWDSGCRIGELGSMTISSVHFEDQGTIVDFSGKTGKRSAFVVESTPYLAAWLREHPFKNDPYAPLWISRNQDPKYRDQALSYRQFYKLFQRTFEKTEIKKKFNPHLFRHSRALWCAQHNWNNVMANKMFGWGMSSSMYNYYVSLATEDLKDKMLQDYGLSNKRKDDIEERKPRVCPRCETINEKTARCCGKCGLLLDPKAAEEVMKLQRVEEKMKAREKKLHEHVFSRAGASNLQEKGKLVDALYDFIKSNPDLLEELKGIPKVEVE